jgi:hypothetical protein
VPLPTRLIYLTHIPSEICCFKTSAGHYLPAPQVVALARKRVAGLDVQVHVQVSRRQSFSPRRPFPRHEDLRAVRRPCARAIPVVMVTPTPPERPVLVLSACSQTILLASDTTLRHLINKVVSNQQTVNSSRNTLPAPLPLFTLPCYINNTALAT